MLELLKRGRDEHGVVAVKAEFEAEGTRPDEFLRLLDLARRADLKVALNVSDTTLTDTELRTHLATWLPDYMLPTYFRRSITQGLARAVVVKNDLHLGVDGDNNVKGTFEEPLKIDRRKLKHETLLPVRHDSARA